MKFRDSCNFTNTLLLGNSGILWSVYIFQTVLIDASKTIMFGGFSVKTTQNDLGLFYVTTWAKTSGMCGLVNCDLVLLLLLPLFFIH